MLHKWEHAGIYVTSYTSKTSVPCTRGYAISPVLQATPRAPRIILDIGLLFLQRQSSVNLGIFLRPRPPTQLTCQQGRIGGPMIILDIWSSLLTIQSSVDPRGTGTSVVAVAFFSSLFSLLHPSSPSSLLLLCYLFSRVSQTLIIPIHTNSIPLWLPHF